MAGHFYPACTYELLDYLAELEPVTIPTIQAWFPTLKHFVKSTVILVVLKYYDGSVKEKNYKKRKVNRAKFEKYTHFPSMAFTKT